MKILNFSLFYSIYSSEKKVIVWGNGSYENVSVEDNYPNEKRPKDKDWNHKFGVKISL